jgi:hypothetical protein
MASSNSLARFWVWAFLLGLAMSPAYAQIAGTTTATFRGTTPVSPVAGQPFVLNVASGPCEYLNDTRTGARIVSVIGTVVTIHVTGLPDQACSLPRGERQYDLAGISSPGVYEFRVIYESLVEGEVTQLIGSQSITVVAQGTASGGAVTVPAWGRWASAVLVGLMLVMAWPRGKSE